ncbi:MAG: XdhC family protein [Pseudomonadales bacterium]|nr:XdhC family protein [Pseudomonadales bacterium]
MDSINHQVIATLTEWLDQQLDCWLCTIVKTWGSSPRPIGSLLACNSKGEVTGSLSGGCVEEDLIEKLLRSEHAATGPEQIRYGVRKSESDRLGLPCGGRLEVLAEPVFSSDGNQNGFRGILEALDSRRCIQRTLDLMSGIQTIETVDQYQPLSIDAQHLTQYFGPRYRLLLIGAGQIATYLSEMAQSVDFQVLVCDPRQEIIDQWPVMGATMIQGMPDDLVREHATDGYCAVITLAHDPRIDDMALMEALKGPAFHIGAIGSQRTSQARINRLKQLELTDQEIGRLKGPVGLDIGSKSPPEIAISIIAELIQVRKQLQLDTLAR